MKVTSFSSSRTKLCLAIAATLATFVPALATAQQSNAGSVEEIQVTGTRVRLADGMSAPTPVTTLSPLTNCETSIPAPPWRLSSMTCRNSSIRTARSAAVMP